MEITTKKNTLSEDVPSIFGLLSFQLVIPKINLKSIIIDDKELDKTKQI